MKSGSLDLLATQLNSCLRDLENEARAQEGASGINVEWQFSVSGGDLDALTRAFAKDQGLGQDFQNLVHEAVASESWRLALRGLLLQRLAAALLLKSNIVVLQGLLAGPQSTLHRQATHHNLISAQHELTRISRSGLDGHLAKNINHAVGWTLLDGLRIKALTLCFASDATLWQLFTDAIEGIRSSKV
jgi:hypothetical protein